MGTQSDKPRVPTTIGSLAPDLKNIQPKMTQTERFKQMMEGAKFPYGKAPEGVPQALYDERMRASRKK
jgi:hypothetical protein